MGYALTFRESVWQVLDDSVTLRSETASLGNRFPDISKQRVAFGYDRLEFSEHIAQ
jgi:hypothetical protein